jgi:hypothetical protein
VGAEGLRRGDWQLKKVGLTPFWPFFCFGLSFSSFGIPASSLSVPSVYTGTVISFQFSSMAHVVAVWVLVFVFWRTCTFFNLFTMPLAGLAGCWTCPISHSTLAMCSLSFSCYYLMINRCCNWVHKLLDRPDVTGFLISVLRTVLTLSSDLDQLFGNTDDLIISTTPGIRLQLVIIVIR